MEKYSIFCSGFSETARITINDDGKKEYLLVDDKDIAMRTATLEEFKDFVNKISWCETSWSKKLREDYKKLKEVLFEQESCSI